MARKRTCASRSHVAAGPDDQDFLILQIASEEKEGPFDTLDHQCRRQAVPRSHSRGAVTGGAIGLEQYRCEAAEGNHGRTFALGRPDSVSDPVECPPGWAPAQVVRRQKRVDEHGVHSATLTVGMNAETA